MTIVESVGWVLLHFVWQGAVIALALAVLLALTPEGQARLRYALSCGALTLMLIAAAATAAAVMSGAPASRPAAPSGNAATLGSVPRQSDGRPGGSAGDAAGTPANGIRTPLPAAASAAGRAFALAQPIVARAMPWLVLVWLSGVLALSIRLLGGWWSTRSLRLVEVSPAPDWCEAKLAALSARMRVERAVAIVSSFRTSVPVVLGHMKPVIVLPAAALSGLSPAQLDAILAHELAHVRRHDYLVNLAQAVIETLLFYHPAVWWVSRQVRETREHCCDDLAVTVCRSRREYVHALLDLEQLRDSTPAFALGATDGSLLARGRRLLAPPERAASAPRLAASVIALFVVASAVAGASWTSAAVPAGPDPQPVSSTASAPAPSETLQAGGTTPVTLAPNAASPLASRWTWAEGAARSAGRRAYWIGYSVAPVRTLPPVMYHDRSSSVFSNGMTFNGQLFSSDATGLRFPGRPLAVPSEDGHSVKVLFALDASRVEPTLTAVHTSTLSLPVDTKGRTVYWLGRADAAESLDRIDRFYRSASRSELKQDLLSAAAVLDASPAVVAWLEARVASQDPDAVRGDAAERIAWHPIAASVAALDRIARGDRSSRVRQEAAEALGDLQMPEAAPVLIALARTLPDRDARLEAVEALGARPEPAASEALESIARTDTDVDIQREAVETLGDVGGAAALAQLRTLATTHLDERVRAEAIESLGDSDAPAAETAAFLEQLALAETSTRVQSEALETLVDLRDGAGIATLVNLARSHPSENTRKEALERLLDSDHPDARALFERALKKTPGR